MDARRSMQIRGARIHRRRRGIAVTVTVGFLSALTVIRPLSAAADSVAPSVYGWWSQSSVNGTDPTARDVPPDGMLVQNGPSAPSPGALPQPGAPPPSPLAVSALQFSLAPTAGAGTLTLSITGQAVITQPPLVYRATNTFTAAEGGSWSAAPGYDSSHPIIGVVNAASTEVQFTVASLATTGSLAVVVLAGGAADRIAFTKPGPDSLSETVAPPVAGVTPPASVTAPTRLPPPISVPLPIPGPGVPPPATTNPGVAALPPPARAPVADSGTATVGPPSSGRAVLGPLAVALLVLAILYWTDGFGALRLRTSIAGHRLRRPG
jgi:hypothetical protein